MSCRAECTSGRRHVQTCSGYAAGERYERQQKGMTCKKRTQEACRESEDGIMEMTRFEELGLDERILRAVTAMGFEETTPIQARAIPVQMKGTDIIGQAQTGTGKTAAFGISILQKLDVRNKKLQAVVLCPTRELAIQVAEELRSQDTAGLWRSGYCTADSLAQRRHPDYNRNAGAGNGSYEASDHKA